MRVDVEVSKAKFHDQVQRVKTQAGVLAGWGCLLVSAEFPTIRLLFVPKPGLRVSFLTPLTAPRAESGASELHVAAVTIDLGNLGAAAFGVEISLDDFDIRAPSVIFCDPWNSWKPLPYGEMQRANLVDDTGKALSVLLGEHPIFRRPFLCVRGVREYHEHPQHSGDEWLLYRQNFGVFHIIMQIWQTCIVHAAPHLSLTAPQQIQVNWEASRVSLTQPGVPAKRLA